MPAGDDESEGANVPLVTVILTVFKRTGYLEAALKSVSAADLQRLGMSGHR